MEETKSTLNKIGMNAAKNIAMKKIEKGFFENMAHWFTKASKCNFDSIKQHFDTDETMVRKRLLYSLFPFNPYFFDITKDKPDLYGPLWIFSTLVFIIAASGEISKYLNIGEDNSYFETFVPRSALLIYGIGIGLPLALWLLMKFFGAKPSYVLLQCTYGYSFTAYIPASLICILPYTTVHIIVLGIAVGISTSLILINCWRDFNQFIKSRAYFLISLIAIFQLIIYLILVLYFFGMNDKIDQIKNTIVSTAGNIANNVNHIIHPNSTSTNTTNTNFSSGGS